MLSRARDLAMFWTQDTTKVALTDGPSTPARDAHSNSMDSRTIMRNQSNFDKLSRTLSNLRKDDDEDDPDSSGKEIVRLIYNDSHDSDEQPVRKCQILLANNPALNLDQRFGAQARSVLHRAAKHGNSTLTKLLLIHGAKINTKDLDNRTPLHDAAASGHTRTVMVLLEDKSIQIDSIDHDGNTPLVLAILNGHRPIAELLVNSGAKLDLRIGEGQHRRGSVHKQMIGHMRNASGVQGNMSSGMTIFKLLIRLMPAVAVRACDRYYTCVEREVWGVVGHITCERGTTDLHRQSMQEHAVSDEALKTMTKQRYLTGGASKMDLESQPQEPTPRGNFMMWRFMKRRSVIEKKGLSYGELFEGRYGVFDEEVIAMMIKLERNELISHPLVQTLINYKWKIYRFSFRRTCYIYFCFVAVFTLSTWFHTGLLPATHKDAQAVRWTVDTILLCLWLDQLRRALTEIWNRGLMAYISGAWQCLDSVILALFVPVFVNYIRDSQVRLRLTHTTTGMAAVLNMLIWCKILYFARGFEVTGPTVLMVGAMIKNTVRLLWVVLLCVAAFAQAFYILASNTPNTGFGTPPQAFFQVFVTLFGGVQYATFSNLGYPEACLLLLVFLLFGVLILLNLLIAKMTATINKINDRVAATWLIQKASLVLLMERRVAEKPGDNRDNEHAIQNLRLYVLRRNEGEFKTSEQRMLDRVNKVYDSVHATENKLLSRLEGIEDSIRALSLLIRQQQTPTPTQRLSQDLHGERLTAASSPDFVQSTPEGLSL